MRRPGWWLLPLLLHQVTCAYKEPRKFLIASDAQDGTIAYKLLPRRGETGGSPNSTMQTLISSGSPLWHPQGIAVDQYRKRLLVADPSAKKVLAFPLVVDGSELHIGMSGAVTLANNVAARWVTVNGQGDVFFTVEESNSIYKVASNGSQPQAVYSGGSVVSPGGVDTDNFNLFWANKVGGLQTGVLLEAPSIPDLAQAPRILSSNIPKSYGVCIAMDAVYYTGDTAAVYSAKRGGGPISLVTGTLGNPRGCAWDGESRIYVADRGLGGIYKFSGPQVLSQTRVDKFVDFPNAFGVAIFSSSRRCAALLPLLFLFLSLC